MFDEKRRRWKRNCKTTPPAEESLPSLYRRLGHCSKCVVRQSAAHVKLGVMESECI